MTFPAALMLADAAITPVIAKPVELTTPTVMLLTLDTILPLALAIMTLELLLKICVGSTAIPVS